ncbi:MAG: aminotransferase class I/II-fold pyridoxal phosphate-dependent enzyme, partial [Woeseiaceae bacterium]|nr:aminotransferase class I/II-fold pyridoxal phosphate-dependent enzyme [Woeseiaceae bacterium]
MTTETRKLDFDAYYSATQLRGDSWSAFKDVAKRLRRRHSEGKDIGQLKQKADELLESLQPIEAYWAFPSNGGFEYLRHQLAYGNYAEVDSIATRIVRALASGAYRRRTIPIGRETQEREEFEDVEETPEQRAHAKPYFEVLIVDALTAAQEKSLRANLKQMRRVEDPFTYEAVIVPSMEDAVIAILVNHNIQSVVVRFGFDLRSDSHLSILHRYLSWVGNEDLDSVDPQDYGPELCRLIHKIRPELDVFLVTDQSVEEVAGTDLGGCRRVFYNTEDFTELHLNILRGVNERYETPFFNALKRYSRQPTGVFHALPISRGKSIARSHWIQDMGEFYGANIFLAETSATSGGLDSLLEPSGPIKRAQDLASRAFGSKHTYFSTNGTSTCNKIVVQAIARPGDIILVDRDCHKSHHYGFVLSGADVVYLDSYPLHPWSMYGAVPIREIKARLLELKREGLLDKVRMLLLTNCTFDGIVYNVRRVMEECLAIKPDLIFLWDEAWFGFARFEPTYRMRTAMHCAQELRNDFRSEAYRARYAEHAAELADASDDELLDARLLPDPDKARVRVYATQSTHKTLTALRQASMIHVHDQDFRGEVEEAFDEAFMTHTSTSPNYQLIASLDVGRRQVELEGFEFVQKQVNAAMAMRRRISSHPLLQQYFDVLSAEDMVPEGHRESGMTVYWDPDSGYSDFFEAWSNDEFVLDPTRITLVVGRTGYDGDSFKNDVLMDRYGIQVNKTSRNSVLFMTNIGTTRSSVAYLIEVLVRFTTELQQQQDDASSMEKKAFADQVTALMEDLPSLPDFSRFHAAFRPFGDSVPAGDLRSAFFLAYDSNNCEYFKLHDSSLDDAMAGGRELVSTSFVIPYPPGFPILVPGQVVSAEILDFMRNLDV